MARNSSTLRIAYITVVWSRPPCRLHVRHAKVVVLGDPSLDLFDGHPALVGTQQVLEDLLGHVERDRSSDQRRLRHDPVQGAFQLAHIRGDAAGQEVEHRVRDHDFLRDHAGFGLQDVEPQLVRGRVDVDHQPPAQTRADPLLEAGQVGRAAVRGDHDLSPTVDQGVESVEELLLGGLLTPDELDVVDHQHVGRAEQLLEPQGVPAAQRLDELIHELLGGQVHHLARGVLAADLPGDGVHQVGLAEPDAAVKEQRVERRDGQLGDALGRREGELVRLADDEVLERAARIKRGADLRVGGDAFDRNRHRDGRTGYRLGRGKRRCGHRHDVQRHAADPGIDPPPENADPVGIVGGYPVAQESGRHREQHPLAFQAAKAERREPGVVGGFAKFRPQHAPNLRPLSVEISRGTLRLEVHQDLRHATNCQPAHARGRQHGHCTPDSSFSGHGYSHLIAQYTPATG